MKPDYCNCQQCRRRFKKELNRKFRRQDRVLLPMNLSSLLSEALEQVKG